MNERDAEAFHEAEYHRACDGVKASHPGFRIFKRPDMYQSRSVAFLQGENPYQFAGNPPSEGRQVPVPWGAAVERELLRRTPPGEGG